MQLVSATIFKYKSIQTTQRIALEPDVTVLVGVNESGKTSVLEAIAKTNYHDGSDSTFKFNATHDYPRLEKKKFDKTGENVAAVACQYRLKDAEKKRILEAVGAKGFDEDAAVTVTSFYGSSMRTYNTGAMFDTRKIVEFLLKQAKIHSKDLAEKLRGCKTLPEYDLLTESYKDEAKKAGLKAIRPWFENSWGWADPIYEACVRKLVDPLVPKFLYYDEYYSLPSRVDIAEIGKAATSASPELKTAKALFELADIDVESLQNADSFEDFTAELEATQGTISNELFKFWKTNSNLDIVFKIDTLIDRDAAGAKISKRILDIRVYNSRSKMSLPLRNRSKGFNWFFSFLVWFQRIQEEANGDYIILLDEPGLNLHASAQKDLLAFIESLSPRYQVVYTTHSPFMIESDNLRRVRTIVETDDGTNISDSVQEKDPRTLFPLQAALGYDIAQNLFVSERNLLVEGISELVLIQHASAILETLGRTSLRADVTIVPTGGLDKVATFISLLRGSSLSIVCLLDTVREQKTKSSLDKQVREKIISANKILSFDEFVDGMEQADLEDLLLPARYCKAFNTAFKGRYAIEQSSLQAGSAIIPQVARIACNGRFNHYLPIREFVDPQGSAGGQLEDGELQSFEAIFDRVNSLF